MAQRYREHLTFHDFYNEANREDIGKALAMVIQNAGYTPVIGLFLLGDKLIQ